MATLKQTANSPDYKCAAYRRMLPAIEMMQDIWAGEETIKRKRTRYLWKSHEGEDPADYNRRLKASYFFNVTARTISGIVGMVCRHDIVPQTVPEPIKELFTDIDMCGNDLDMFLREAFTNAVRDGHSFILVDAPPALALPEGERATLADVADRRPFCVNYRADQALNWQYEVENGRLILTQITFREETVESDGSQFGEQSVTRYRVLRRGSYSLYRKNGVHLVAEKDGEGEPVIDRPTGLDEIPLAVIYGKKVAPMESAPPLKGIADLNICHYNEKSDLKAWAHVACVPVRTLQFDSREDAEKYAGGVAASVSSAIVGWGDNFKHYFVEVSGSGINLAKDLANETVADMAKLGLNMFEPKKSYVEKTAFEVAAENTADHSDVSLMARNLENAFEIVVWYLAEYLNAIHGEGTVRMEEAETSQFRLKINYDKLTFSLAQIQLFSNLVDTGKLPLQIFLQLLFNYTDMPKDVTADEAYRKLIEERGLNLPPVGGFAVTGSPAAKTTVVKEVQAGTPNPDNENFGV